MRGLEENQEQSDEKEQLRLRIPPPHPHPRNGFLRLPEEIMLNIISRLPVESVLDCRIVCKTWSNLPLLCHDNHFAYMHLRRHHQQYLHHHNHSNSAATNKMSIVILGCRPHQTINYVEFDKNIDEQSFTRPVVTRINLPLPLDLGCMVGSCNGLICLSVQYRKSNFKVEDPVYVCNPITREYVNLPRCVMIENDIYMEVVLVHGFGYHPLTNEYKVVRIYYCDVRQKPVVGRVQVYTLGSGSGWRNIGEITYLLQDSYISNSVLLNGTLYWLAKGDKIVAFDLAEEEFYLLPSPPFSFPNWSGKSKLWLLEGWLCLVHQESIFNLDIRLLKKNELKETWSWNKEFSVGTSNRRVSREHQPLAITKSGGISLLYLGRHFVHYDPKTATSKILGHLDNSVLGNVVLSHFHSFVSLKALGENSLRAIGENAKISFGVGVENSL